MYTDYFGFQKNPFNITPDPQFFYVTPGYQEAYASLLYGVRERKGVILLTGEAGMGKTTLLYRLKEHFTSPVHCLFLPYTNIAFDELLSFLCLELGLPADLQGRLQKIQALQAFLGKCLQAGGTGVLLIDEAQDIEDQVLEDLRILSNLETTSEKLLQIILAGQPELELKLAQPQWRRMRERITVKHRLAGLQEQEILAFIHHRLHTVGYERQDLFPSEAVQRIAVYSKQTPRLINNICDNALHIAYRLNKKTVSANIIEEVAQNLDLKPLPGIPSTTAVGESLEPRAAAKEQQERLPSDLTEILEWKRVSSPAASRSALGFPNRRIQIGLSLLLGLFLLGGAMVSSKKLSGLFAQRLNAQVALSGPQNTAPENAQHISTHAPQGSPRRQSAAPQAAYSDEPPLTPASQANPVRPFIPVPQRQQRARHENSSDMASLASQAAQESTHLVTTQLLSTASDAQHATASAKETSLALLPISLTGKDVAATAAALPPPSASQPSPPLRTEQKDISLAIEKGATISDIMLQVYGTYSPLTFDLIYEFNPHIQDLDRVSPGQQLRLPALTQDNLLRKQPDGSYQLILASFYNARRAHEFSQRVSSAGYTTETIQRRVSHNLLLHRVALTGLPNREAADQVSHFIYVKDHQ